MEPGAKGAFLSIVVLGVCLALILYFGPDYLRGGVVIASERVLPSATVEGDVLAVESIAEGNLPARKEAIVKLTTGETVRAYVPGACIVFPGQVAKLLRFDHRMLGKSFYEFKEAREKE